MEQGSGTQLADNTEIHLDMFEGHDRSRPKRLRNGGYMADILRPAFRPKTVIDMGCGLGFFLKAMAERGSNVTGVDNDWVEELHTEIPKDRYIIANLNQPFEVTQRYDMACSFECAEHLSRRRGPDFVKELCALSDVVAFSAAVPFQGGSGHRNPQWQEYWAELFADEGYECYDFIRPTLAGNGDVFLWFRQNPLIFIKQGAHVPVKVRPFKILPRAATKVQREQFMRQRKRLFDRIEKLEAELTQHREKSSG